MSPDALKAAAADLAETSCEAQGLDVTITDPVVVGKVAAVLRSGGSDAPRGLDAGGVEGVAPADGRPDRDVLKNGAEDRAAAAEREPVPRFAES